MRTYAQAAAKYNGKRINWTIGDNSGTSGLYLNTHNKELEAITDSDPFQNPLYYIEAHVHTQEQRDELLKLILDWNNAKPELQNAD